MAVEAQSPVEAMSHTEVFEEIGVWRRVTAFLTNDVFHNWWMSDHYERCWDIAEESEGTCACFWAREAESHNYELCTSAWQLSFVSRHIEDSVLAYGWRGK